MDFTTEILEGEKICSQMEELANQIAAVWRDPAAAVFLDKYSSVCSNISENIRKLGEL